MDHAAVLALFDRDMREGARPFGLDSVVERVGGVVRHVGPEKGWNGVLWSDLTEADADAAIAEQVALLHRAGPGVRVEAVRARPARSTWGNGCAPPGSRPSPRRR